MWVFSQTTGKLYLDYQPRKFVEFKEPENIKIASRILNSLSNSQSARLNQLKQKKFEISNEYKLSRQGQLRSFSLTKQTRRLIVNSYSGAPNFVNDPDQQNVKDKGTIPRGTYKMEPPVKSARTGWNIGLTPAATNKMFGRHTFQIHGDKIGAAPQTSSNGCIIINKTIRDSIWATAKRLSDFTLIVER